MIVLFGMHRLDMAGWREAILYTLYISTYLHEEKEREREIYMRNQISDFYDGRGERLELLPIIYDINRPFGSSKHTLLLSARRILCIRIHVAM